MSSILSELFSGSNNPKIEEMLNRTRDVAETVGKKSAEHIELSRKRIEYLDAKSKLSKQYEKFGQLQYDAYMGEYVNDEELEALAQKITTLKERITVLSEEIDEAKASFAETMQTARETFQKEMEKATGPKSKMDASEFFETEDDDFFTETEEE